MAQTKIIQTANNIRRIASYEYANRIPVATQANINAIAQTLTEYQPLANEFLNALVNRIVRVLIKNKLFENPLRAYKQGMEGYGDTVEEIFVNIANAHMYDPSTAEDEVFKREIPDVAAVFHRVNSQVFYKATIQNESLSKAFVDDGAMQNFISRIVDSLYTGANYDEFMMMKQLLAVNKDYYYPVHVDPLTADTANSFITTVKGVSNLLPFGGGRYNKFGLFNATPKENQVLILRADYDAVLDVNSLAAAFNLEYVQFVGRRIIVDKFPAGMENVVAMLTDDQFFMVFNRLDKFTEQYNAQGLYWNYFYHIWRLYSVSPFSNVVVFTTDEVDEVSSVTVNGDDTANAGDTKQYTAELTGGKDKAVVWSVSGQKRGGTYISPSGALTIDANEPAGTLTVKATSLYTETQSGTKEVTIS